MRLPVPFWAIDAWAGEPFLQHTSWTYALKAFAWARKYGLRVLLDVHTAPGSQNGCVFRVGWSVGLCFLCFCVLGFVSCVLCFVLRGRLIGLDWVG